MASTTGIELGRESCVLVGVRSSGAGTADVMALHTIEPGAWPTMEVALVEMLRGLRRRKGFPRNARIVAWGLQDDPSGDHGTARALQRPLVAAGFRIESVLTPPQALALLAASRPRHTGEGAVAWLALNMRGAAIAIVHGGELLFARTFEWSYDTRLMSGKAQLLQRYSLVAQLAPEVRRGIAAVRAGRGISVEAAVTCGDLPDLRSLTMPLIEELDLEVETLDSTDGLRAVGKAKAERFAESAPAIRLACAAAMAHSKQRPSATRWAAGVAAAIALVAALGWGSYAYWRGAIVGPAALPQATAPSTPVPSAAQRPGGPTGAAARGPGTPQVVAQGPAAAQPATGMPAAPGKATPAAPLPGPAATPVPPKPAGGPIGTAIVTPPAKPEPGPIPPAKVEPLPVKPPAAPPRTAAPPVANAAPPRTASRRPWRTPHHRGLSRRPWRTRHHRGQSRRPWRTPHHRGPSHRLSRTRRHRGQSRRPWRTQHHRGRSRRPWRTRHHRGQSRRLLRTSHRRGPSHRPWRTPHHRGLSRRPWRTPHHRGRSRRPWRTWHHRGLSRRPSRTSHRRGLSHRLWRTRRHREPSRRPWRTSHRRGRSHRLWRTPHHRGRSRRPWRTSHHRGRSHRLWRTSRHRGRSHRPWRTWRHRGPSRRPRTGHRCPSGIRCRKSTRS